MKAKRIFKKEIGLVILSFLLNPQMEDLNFLIYIVLTTSEMNFILRRFGIIPEFVRD